MRTLSQNSGYGVDRAGSVFRIYMGGHAVINWIIAMTDPRSLVHGAASTIEGEVLASLLMLVGVAAMLDAAVNDFMPDRFHWRVALRQRHFILTAMAFCYAAQLFTAFSQHVSTGLLLPDLWSACSIMFVAFIDAHQRNKDAQCAICN